MKGHPLPEVRPRSRDHLRLELNPKGTIQLGGQWTYKAFTVAEDGTELEEVTGQTDFSITNGPAAGSCQGAS